MGRHQREASGSVFLWQNTENKQHNFLFAELQFFLNGAPSRSRCTSTIQHRTTLSTAPSSSHSHCDFTRCRRRHRSHRGRQLGDLVAHCLYRRTRSSWEVKNRSKRAGEQAPFRCRQRCGHNHRWRHGTSRLEANGEELLKPVAIYSAGSLIWVAGEWRHFLRRRRHLSFEHAVASSKRFRCAVSCLLFSSRYFFFSFLVPLCAFFHLKRQR